MLNKGEKKMAEARVFEKNYRHDFHEAFESNEPIVGVGPFEIRNSVDENGNPAGGKVLGHGLHVFWQDGPTQRKDIFNPPLVFYRKTGAFVEDLIYASIKRIEFYQSSKFACEDNAEAIEHLKKALECTQRRHKERVNRGVHGTHER